MNNVNYNTAVKNNLNGPPPLVDMDSDNEDEEYNNSSFCFSRTQLRSIIGDRGKKDSGKKNLHSGQYNNLDKMKFAAFNTDLSRMVCTGRYCPNKKRCLVDKITRGHIYSSRVRMWGQEENTASNWKHIQRYTRDSLISSFSHVDKKFHFIVSEPGFEDIEICEKAWLRVHGIEGKGGRRPQWYKHLCDRIAQHLPPLQRFPVIKNHLKRMEINIYLNKFKNERSDYLPTSQGETYMSRYCVPFATATQFYKDFVFTSVQAHLANHDPSDDTSKALCDLNDPDKGIDVVENYSKALHLGSYKTFQRVLITEHQDIHYMKCKGSFPSCDVCVGAMQLLNDRKKWNDMQRQAIYLWQKEHIEQQAAERRDQAIRIEQAKNSFDKVTGQPLYLYMTADAMTDYTTRTPKLQSKLERVGKTEKNNDNKIKARVMGFHVVCGPYEGCNGQYYYLMRK